MPFEHHWQPRNHSNKESVRTWWETRVYLLDPLRQQLFSIIYFDICHQKIPFRMIFYALFYTHNKIEFCESKVLIITGWPVNAGLPSICAHPLQQTKTRFPLSLSSPFFYLWLILSFTHSLSFPLSQVGITGPPPHLCLLSLQDSSLNRKKTSKREIVPKRSWTLTFYFISGTKQEY